MSAVWWLAAWLTAWLGGAASAQDCGPDPAAAAAADLDRARAALRADEANEPCALTDDGGGLDPACVTRLAPVIADLERSIACHPSLAAYNNLGVALRRQGRVMQALALFEAILRGEHGALTATQRASIEEQIERARGDLAMLEIGARDEAGPHDAEVRVDERVAGAVSASEPVLRVVVDPGLHRVEAVSGTHAAPEPARVPVGRGEVRDVTISLSRALRALAAPAAPAPRDDTPWIVLGVGGGVALVAGGIVLGVVLAQPALPGPVVSVPEELLGR